MALTDQEMGPGWSINSSIIMSPEINLKSSQKQPKTKISYEGLQRPLTDQEMGPGWSINSSIIMSPEINLKSSQKQPKTLI